jgi:hypothetical protein
MAIPLLPCSSPLLTATHFQLPFFLQLYSLWPLCTDPTENTVSYSISIVACVSVAVGTCLPSRCLETALHATVCLSFLCQFRGRNARSYRPILGTRIFRWSVCRERVYIHSWQWSTFWAISVPTCVFSSTMPINLHDNKSALWRISLKWRHKYPADSKQLYHTRMYVNILLYGRNFSTWLLDCA